MFSLLVKLISCILDWSSLSTQKVKQKIAETTDTSKEKVFIGVVTNINSLEEYGIINKEVYFSFNVVYAKRNLEIGDTVLVRAKREEFYHAWTAFHVEFKCKTKKEMSDNHHNSSVPAEGQEKMYRTETVVQTVSECNGDCGKLKDGFEFSLEDGEIDFVPIIGDVLSATVCYTQGGKKVTSWKPKEVKCIEGEVTAYENDCGVINDEIMFFRSSCRRTVKLYVGQKVSAMIASSQQGVFKWRAYSLSTSSNANDDETLRKPHLNEWEGIYITDPIHFETVCLGQENGLQVTLQNNSNCSLSFYGCHFHSKNGIFYLSKTFSAVQEIPEHSNIIITLHCKTESIGQHEDIMLFEFTKFIIKRSVSVTVIDPMQDMLKPTAPFSHKNKSVDKMADYDSLVIIPGRKPYKPVSHFNNKLPPCNIPKNLLRAVQNREDLTHIVPWVFQNLTLKNYVPKFRTLLHLEEVQVRYDLKKFDISEAVLQKKGEFLSLEVSGLAEGRPSLVIGDKAILVPPYNKSNFGFEGCIHEVHLNEVLLKFSDSFHSSYGGESFDVRFELNRTNFRLLHQCVHQVFENHEYAIFPTKLVLKDPLISLGPSVRNVGKSKRQKFQISKLSSASICWKNSKLNWKQKEAVLLYIPYYSF